jgi:hypothetical protein
MTWLIIEPLEVWSTTCINPSKQSEMMGVTTNEPLFSGGTMYSTGWVPMDEWQEHMCSFMKGGGCGAVFKAWERCVDTHRNDPESFAERCMEATKRLQVRPLLPSKQWTIVLPPGKSSIVVL